MADGVRLFHLAEVDQWTAAGDEYVPAAFAAEGFVHCSYREQVAATRARHYAGRTDLVLLEIDPARLRARVLDEPSPTTGELYPHIYGPINRDAVVAVHAFDSI